MDHIKELEGKKILLLSGGWSAEREVSIRSGAAVSESLDRLSLEYTHLDLTSEEESGNISDEFNLAFIALHGRGGEDGFIQEVLESKDIEYTGSNSQSCKTSLNKIEAKKIWRELLLPTPDFVEIINVGNPDMKLTPHLSGEEDITALDKTFVVKPANEGSSFGISIVRPGKGSLETSMKQASKFDSSILVEAFVDSDAAVQRFKNHAESPIASEVLEHVNITSVYCFGNAKHDLVDILSAWGAKIQSHYCGFNHR